MPPSLSCILSSFLWAVYAVAISLAIFWLPRVSHSEPGFQSGWRCGRGADRDEQEDRQDAGFANADNAPVIQEMEFCLRRRGYFKWIHRSKKRGASPDSPAPRPYVKFRLIARVDSKVNTVSVKAAAKT